VSHVHAQLLRLLYTFGSVEGADSGPPATTVCKQLPSTQLGS